MVFNKKIKHLPLTATSIIGSTIFIITLSLLSSIVSYNVSKIVLYNHYQTQMTSIMNSVEGFFDHDDMYNCNQTQTESEKYKTVQYILDSLAEDCIDIHCVYILQPADDARGAITVVSGSTQEDDNLGDDVHLGEGGEDWYSTELINELRRIYAQDRDVFFYEDSATWGRDYTLLRPVKNSQGQKYGLLCVDNIDKSVQQIVFYSLTIILGIGTFFVLALIAWMHIFIIRLIKKLQLSVAEYANKAAMKKN